jgi:hypothetical protein
VSFPVTFSKKSMLAEMSSSSHVLVEFIEDDSVCILKVSEIETVCDDPLPDVGCECVVRWGPQKSSHAAVVLHYGGMCVQFLFCPTFG